MTCPYPGLPTDLQPQLTALLGISEGISSVTDTVFESRFRYLQELEKFGLEYECLDNTVKIKGIQSYLAANVNATDLRGGAACIIAALNAKG
jgi:UDP-N-acetylglucosamine 1-carboxyvinyltransferase